jgi:hypothetical protein
MWEAVFGAASGRRDRRIVPRSVLILIEDIERARLERRRAAIVCVWKEGG